MVFDEVHSCEDRHVYQAATTMIESMLEYALGDVWAAMKFA